ncbi:hypothetical protein Bca4012_061486 [Brassica carinata]
MKQRRTKQRLEEIKKERDEYTNSLIFPGMGDCISGSICTADSVVCKKVVSLFSKWLCARWSYIHNLPENLEALEKAMDELKAKRKGCAPRGRQRVGKKRSPED